MNRLVQKSNGICCLSELKGKLPAATRHLAQVNQWSLEKASAYIDEKFAECKKKYGDRIYIILTDKDIDYHYKKYNIRMLLRKEIIEFIRLQFSGEKNSDIGKDLKRVNSQILSH